MDERPRHRAFVLRGWMEERGEGRTEEWRFRVSDVQSGEQWGFASLEGVTDFLGREFKRDFNGDDALPDLT